ncbi:carbon starvation protein A [Candidatus Pacearchaeota archaeon CG10_big_fil_rev_8_21_14_0_10_32_42]|nr:MAG: carbon starvation protein A [Candidatus Pacearchaeota archaeon CG10_big_fil_rev_8_21_14_0_10_32_42]
MNAALIVIIAVIWMFLGYRFYGKFIEKRIKVNDREKTPAVTNRNKVDFSPAKKNFLAGHHFASIAGAGPIIGPILAISYFGWVPVAIWVLIGSVFIGAMHDYISLIASVRNKAKGVAAITSEHLNKRAGWIFGLMIFITLILVVTVFSVSSAESIIEKPSLIIPLATITLVAVLFGIGLEKFKLNPKIMTSIAVILIAVSIWAGEVFTISSSIINPSFTRIFWITLIFIYAFIASVIPVSVLLRPRDFLSSIQLVFTLLLGFVGIMIVRPLINAPEYISGSSFTLWPVLFITVACGAISGFHGLVSSGTTSKQLSKESDARRIGYGGMLMEGLLAILVTLIAVAGLSWGSGIPGSFQDLLSKGWIVLFSDGFGNIIGQIGIPLITTSVAGLIGAFMVNQFILTSVDTSSRLGRFVFSETLFPKIKNRFFVTLIVLIPAWLLAVSNSYQTLWRLFGTSNQLIASITLIGVSAYFISKKIKVKFILIPMVFVLITTMYSLLYLTFRTGGYLSEGNLTLAIISILMFVLGAMVSFEGFREIFKKKK